MPPKAKEKGTGWSLFSARRPKVAKLGEESTMYFNEKLKRWVERGKEGEVQQEDGPAAPPTIAALPTGPTVASAKRALSQRYVLQNNLSVSSSANSLNGEASSAMVPANSGLLLPAASSTPPLIPPRFFMPAQAPVPDAAATADTASSGPTFFMPSEQTGGAEETNKPIEQPQGHFNTTDAMLMAMDGKQDASDMHANGSANGTAQQLYEVDTSTTADSGYMGSAQEGTATDTSQGGTAQYAAPAAKPHPAAPPPAIGCHDSISKSAAQQLKSKGKDLLGALTAFVPAPSVLAAPDGLLASLMGAEDGLDFEGVMHPGGTHKLDGPLPWELPDPLKHSDQFISICSNWQKHNPGRSGERLQVH
ncbi:hypothetical protein V8C86DRAFT_1708070 [Haematococcus lacustris]